MFSAVRFNKASLQIVSQIRGMIFEGKLAPGDKLPPESVLLEQFQVSKQTLKEALRALEYMGLLDIRKGVAGGAFVMEVDSVVIREILSNFLYFKNLSIRNLSEVRKVIEPYAAAMAARSMAEEELKKLRACIETSRTLQAQRLYSPEMAEGDLEFHRIIANGTHNPIFALMVDFVENILADLKTVIKPGAPFAASVLEAHEKVYDAITNKDPERAAAEMLRHVTEVENNLSQLEDEIGVWKASKA